MGFDVEVSGTSGVGKLGCWEAWMLRGPGVVVSRSPNLFAPGPHDARVFGPLDIGMLGR